MFEGTVLVAIFGLGVAGVVKGATGLGYASCALPFLVLAFGLQPAMAMVIAPAIATNIGLALTAGHFAETVRRFYLLYAMMVPGIIAGVQCLAWVPQQNATRLLGVVIVTYAMIALSKPNMILRPSLEVPLQAPTGFFNGLLTGLTGAQVMPLFPYVMSLRLDPDRTVQTVNIAVLLSTIALGGSLAGSGLMTASEFFLSVAGTIPALIGVWIGNRARRYLPQDRYRQLALTTLLLLGTLMLLR